MAPPPPPARCPTGGQRPPAGRRVVRTGARALLRRSTDSSVMPTRTPPRMRAPRVARPRRSWSASTSTQGVAGGTASTARATRARSAMDAAPVTVSGTPPSTSSQSRAASSLVEGAIRDQVDDADRGLAHAAEPGRPPAAHHSSTSAHTAWMTRMCISWMRAVSLEGTTIARSTSGSRRPPVPPVSAHVRAPARSRGDDAVRHARGAAAGADAHHQVRGSTQGASPGERTRGRSRSRWRWP